MLSYSVFRSAKTDLEIAIKWNEPIDKIREKQLINMHVKALMHAYCHISDKELGLKKGQRREEYLQGGMEYYLRGLKEGKYEYAAIYLQDQFAGHVVTEDKMLAIEKIEAKSPETDTCIKHEVTIHLLAVTIFQSPISNQQLRIGLGQELMKAVEKHYPQANSFTLDFREQNTAAKKFYESLGYKLDETKTNKERFIDYTKPRLPVCRS